MVLLGALAAVRSCATNVSVIAEHGTLHGALSDLARVAKYGASSGELTVGGDLPRISTALVHRLRVEAASIRSSEVIRIIGACCRLEHSHPPLLDAAAAHVLRAMPSYPLYAICNIPNGFARLNYHHRPLFEAIAGWVAAVESSEQLSPVDVASLVYAFAELRHGSAALLEACAERLKACHTEVGGPNCAIILNSYARLSECNPELFHALLYSIVQTKPESYEVHHITVIMNAFSKCRIQKPKEMQQVSSFLEGRVRQLSPQNMANLANACAKLKVHNQRLFSELQNRAAVDDLGAFKLFELTMFVHGLAKLRYGVPELYERFFDEMVVRYDWESQAVAQVLDTMRRKQLHCHDTLIRLMLEHMLKNLGEYNVHPLTQAVYCLLELDALDLTESIPSGLLVMEEGETSSRCVMRLFLERLKQLHELVPLTPIQRLHAQHLVRTYRYRNEIEYNMQPHAVKAFCRSLYDVPASVAASLARPRRRR